MLISHIDSTLDKFIVILTMFVFWAGLIFCAGCVLLAAVFFLSMGLLQINLAFVAYRPFDLIAFDALILAAFACDRRKCKP